MYCTHCIPSVLICICTNNKDYYYYKVDDNVKKVVVIVVPLLGLRL